jgi:hypothetical protein
MGGGQNTIPRQAGRRSQNPGPSRLPEAIQPTSEGSGASDVGMVAPEREKSVDKPKHQEGLFVG